MTQRDEYFPWRLFAAALLIVLAVIVGHRSVRLLENSLGAAGGNYGYTPDPEATRAFLGELEHPLFRDAGRDVIAQAKGKDAFLYRYADKAHRAVYGKPFGPWNQGSIGTCVSFGWGMGSYIGQSVDWATGGLPKPPKLVATEPLYGGSRTFARLPPVTFAGWSDGSYGAAAARWVSGQCRDKTVGGILFREQIPGGVDLTTYSIPLSKQWGAYGPPAEVAKLANKHTARAVALCETWEGLAAALESGMCVPICSNVGFASGDRDADGFCRRQSTWNHCMVACSLKWAKNNGPGSATPMKNPRDGVLILNSWGNYVGGGKHPPDQPDGSFWITRQDAEIILAQRDSFVIGSVNGFAYRDLDHGAFFAPNPAEQEQR